jgi:23S rRNA (cytosine1962-C5)-methyltransferase
MKLALLETESYIVIDKPNGFSTHAPDKGKLGIKEIFEKELGFELFVSQRLDKTTTGCLVFQKTASAARHMTEQLTQGTVQKTYRFLTDRVSSQSEFVCTEMIADKPAETLFTRIKRTPYFELWEAQPKTGRQHQIRIHAQKLGIPILGDVDYGGTSFPHLCLHCLRNEFADESGSKKVVESPTPLFFDRMGLLRDTTLVQWMSECDRRQRLYKFLDYREQCLRLVHLPEIRMDQYGEQIWIYWYKNSHLTQTDLERIECFARFLKKPYLVKIMHDRGTRPESHDILQGSGNSTPWQTEWVAQEGRAQYLFSSALGQSPGLFLDQRNNRVLTTALSNQKSVLNLFAYTCGFSVAAAKGGAKQVTSVDVSRRFLDFGKKNFQLNHLDPTQFQFYDMDVLKFLKSTLKKNQRYDLIICDPPSFARSKDSVFKLEEQIDFLLGSCWELLNPEGNFLFSTNFEKWPDSKFLSKIQNHCSHQQFLEVLPAWDFELPQNPRLMKFFWLSKKSQGVF